MNDFWLWLICGMALLWSLAALRVTIPRLMLTLTGWLALPLFVAPDSRVGWSLLGASALVALLLNLPGLRRLVIDRVVYAPFKRALPPLSATERAALEAGTAWWEQELFSGSPDWGKLLSFPAAAISPAAQAFLDGPVERLCAMLDDWELTTTRRDLPPEVWEFLKREGFFGLIIPKRFGGKEFTAHDHSAVVQKVSSRSVAAAVTVMVPNSLGPAELLLHYGTPEQQNHYLPRLARGDEVPCFALTSPHAGSDAAAIPDVGIVELARFNDKETLGIRLTLDKRYITLAPVATLFGVAFHLYDPDALLGDVKDIGITVALIPAGTPGLESGNRHDPLQVPFQNGPVRARDLFIPLDWVIGGPARVGQGWRMLMESLAEGRSISLPALSCGGMKLAARFTGGYARVRQQFQLSIGRFEGVREPLSRIAGQTYLADAARCLTLTAVDLGERPSVVSALVKYQLTERLRKTIIDAMDVIGGAGISLGPRNLLAHVYQSLPIAITVEGANILTRTLITFGQGALRGHPYLLKEVRALEHPDRAQAVRELDQLLIAHASAAVSNLARLVGANTVGRLLPEHLGPIPRAFRDLTRMSAAFAVCTDLALGVLGGNLKRREMLAGRMADALSGLYLATAVIKSHIDRGAPEEELPLFNWSMAHCLSGSEEALRGFLANFPLRPLAVALEWLIFPRGRQFAPPSDHLNGEVAELLLTPSPVRERLTHGIFLPSADTEPLFRLERALESVIAAEPAERKLHAALRAGRLAPALTGFIADPRLLEQAQASGVLIPEEALAIALAHSARSGVVQVDEFASLPLPTLCHLPRREARHPANMEFAA